MGPEENSIPAPAPDSKPEPTPGLATGGSWPNAAMWTAIVLIVVSGLVISFRACVEMPERTIQQAGETIHKASDALATVASAFRSGTVTTSFVSYATTLTNSQRLQFATLKQVEIFTRTEQTTTAFGYVPLPDVAVEARAPVEYTYYLDLDAKWDFVLRDGVIQVFAPPIRANRPSVDVSSLTFEVKKGRFGASEAIENLKGSLSSLALLRAKENIPLVRETGRHETAEFVERWLARSFTDGKSYPVKVYFPGESPPERLQLLEVEPSK